MQVSGRFYIYARPHPGPVTHSLPLARLSRASASGQIPFAASQAAQVPRGEGEPFLRFRELFVLRLNPAQEFKREKS
jgi:hypothetical protein